MKERLESQFWNTAQERSARKSLPSAEPASRKYWQALEAQEASRILIRPMAVLHGSTMLTRYTYTACLPCLGD